MSLQIPIQKDIGEYDEKIVGKLTLRTLCCLALGFSAAVAVAAVLHLGLKVNVSAMTLPIMAAALPFWLAGFCKPYGLPFEKFVPLLASHALNNQSLVYRSCAAIEKAECSPKEKPRRRTRRENARSGRKEVKTMSRQSKQRSSRREDGTNNVRVQGAASRLLAALASRRSKEKDPGRDEARARSSKKRCLSADTASFIAYDALYKDGIAEVEPGLFSQTVEFSDISYQSARKETQEQIFTTLSSLYNYFPAESSVQLTIVNTPIPRELIGKKVFFEPNDERTLGYVDEYNRILNDKMREGVSNLVRRRFLTYSVPAESVEAAVPKLSHIRSDIASTLARIRCDAAPLGGQERLEAISTLVRPGHTPSCDWDKLSQHPRLRTKDLIAPNLMDFAPAGRADAVEIDGIYASVLTLRDFGSVLEDHYLASIIDLPIPLAVSVHIAPIVQSEAIALVKRQIDWMDKEIIDEQTTAAKKGFSQSILTPEIRYAKEEAEELLDFLRNKNEHLFEYTGLIYTYADSLEALDRQVAQVKSIAQGNSIAVASLDFRQRPALNSVLPLGRNHLEFTRYLTTGQVAMQMPFASLELNQEGGGYYGQSKQSGNLVVCNRKLLASPMGFVCGKPGSGKSFSVKREITNTVLAYPEDQIIVFDPAGEYPTLIEALGGSNVAHYAEQMIAIDLDDGVKVNYAKFGDLLAKIK